MREIAAAAGVSPTLPHYYFKTRTELLRRAFEHAEEGMARLEREAAGERSARERLERMLVVYFDADPRVFEIWMRAREMTTHAIRDPALRDSHEDVYGPWTASVAAVVREAQAAGEVAAAVDPDRAAWRLTALVEGIGPWLLRCSVGEEWCPLPAGVWGIAVRKRAGPAAAITVRLVVRPAP